MESDITGSNSCNNTLKWVGGHVQHHSNPARYAARFDPCVQMDRPGQSQHMKYTSRLQDVEAAPGYSTRRPRIFKLLLLKGCSPQRTRAAPCLARNQIEQPNRLNQFYAKGDGMPIYITPHRPLTGRTRRPSRRSLPRKSSIVPWRETNCTHVRLFRTPQPMHSVSRTSTNQCWTASPVCLL